MTRRPDGRQAGTDRKLVDFLPDALAIESKALPWFARGLLYIVLAMIVGGIAWAIFARIEQVVVAGGAINTTDPPIVVQPSETAVIREVNVAIGDRVKAGDPIVKFDPTYSAADLRSLEIQKQALDTRMARLRAEMANEPYEPQELAKQPEISRFRAIETQIARNRKREYDGKMAALDAREAEAQTEIQAIRDKRVSGRKRLAVFNDILEMRQTLLNREVGSRLAVLETRNSVLTLEEEMAAMKAREETLLKTLDGIRAERSSYEGSWQRSISEAMADVQREYERVLSEIVKGKRRRALTDLRAPVDSIVLERAQLSVGSVIQAATPIATLVSADAALQAEVHIDTKDIGLISVGDRVRLKLEAFPFQQFGVLEGRLSRLAPSTRTRQDAQTAPQYVGFVEIVTDLSAEDSAISDIRPGMIVTAEIVLGKRSVISYLLYPVVRAFDEALKEPR